MVLETVAGGAATKVSAVIVAIAMINEVVDLSSLPGLGVIGAAALWAYRTVTKATNDAYATKLKAANDRVAEYERITSEVRIENARLRTLLATSDQADKGDI